MQNKKSLLWPLIISLFLVISCQSEKDVAIASGDLYTIFNSQPRNIGRFYAIYANGITKVNISMYDYSVNSYHSIHLHEGTCEEIGPHWNQGKTTMFCNVIDLDDMPWGKMMAGDIGNIKTNANGYGSLAFSTSLWSIGTNNDTDIIGKLVVLHSEGENFALECDPDHIPDHTHTNVKIACGVISQ